MKTAEQYEKEIQEMFINEKKIEEALEYIKNKLHLLIVEYSDKHPGEYMESKWV